MIPTLLLVGLIAGLTGRSLAVAAAAGVLWPLVLVVASNAAGVFFLLSSALLAVINTAVGLLTGRWTRSAVQRHRVPA